jgi:hypothetical protein
MTDLWIYSFYTYFNFLILINNWALQLQACVLLTSKIKLNFLQSEYVLKMYPELSSNQKETKMLILIQWEVTKLTSGLTSY